MTPSPVPDPRARVRAGEAVNLKDSLATIMLGLDHFGRWTRSRRFHRTVAGMTGVDLGRSGYSILASLEEDGPQRVTDLAERFLLDQSTVSRRVSPLEEKGFIQRTSAESDGRVAILSLTASGRAALARHRKALLDVLGAILARWDKAEIQSLATSMTALASSLAAYLEVS
jgi:DNA-binding MarR family transcriptional regulator